MTALKAMTIWPAWQHFDEEDKGSIEVGKLADFVILSEDPTAVDPETLDQLRVRVTIKEDGVVYAAEREEETRGDRSDFPAGATLAPGFELLEALEDAGADVTARE